MNLVINSIADVFFSLSGLIALGCGAIMLAALGKARIPSLPSYGVGLVVAFVLSILLTKDIRSDAMSDGNTLLLMVLLTLLYAAIFSVVYWIARKKLRAFSGRMVKKNTGKAVPQFSGMRHYRPKKAETPRLR